MRGYDAWLTTPPEDRGGAEAPAPELRCRLCGDGFEPEGFARECKPCFDQIEATRAPEEAIEFEALAAPTAEELEDANRRQDLRDGRL